MGKHVQRSFNEIDLVNMSFVEPPTHYTLVQIKASKYYDIFILL